jgi:hypothetical protein
MEHFVSFVSKYPHNAVDLSLRSDPLSFTRQENDPTSPCRGRIEISAPRYHNAIRLTIFTCEAHQGCLPV